MKKYRPIIFSFITSFIYITFSSMASFLFPIHSRVDQNIFYTLGRGIIEGRVPYRDLFEHKGPLTYFLHAFGAVIDKSSFIGIYILEVAFFTLTIYFMYKIAKLFTTERTSYVAAMLSGAAICTAFCFKVGDNAEEYCFSFLTISLYCLLRFFKNADNELIGIGLEGRTFSANTQFMNYKIVFLNGMLAGFVLWIKFIQLGFWMGWMAIVFFVFFLQKNYKRAFISCFVFLGGMFITALPWVIYFAANGAIKDWLTIYFYDNVVLYAKNNTIWDKLTALFNSLKEDVVQNPLLMFLYALGIRSFCFSKKYFRSRFGRLSVLVTFGILYFMLYIGGVRYDYYMLITGPFCLFGVIAFLDIAKNIPDLMPVKWIKHFTSKGKGTAVIATLLVLTSLYVVAGANTQPYYGKTKADYPQYKFAEIINKKENATLLNYGFIDGGFYLAAGLEPIPGNKYFCKVNISQKVFPEMYDEQISLIAEKKVDFAVIRIRKEHTIEKGMRLEYTDLLNNYKIVAAADDPFESYRFYLLENKDLL